MLTSFASLEHEHHLFFNSLLKLCSSADWFATDTSLFGKCVWQSFEMTVLKLIQFIIFYKLILSKKDFTGNYLYAFSKKFPKISIKSDKCSVFMKTLSLPTYWLLVQLPSITSLVNWFPGVSCECRTQNGQKNFVANRFCLTLPTNSPPTFLVGGSTFLWWYLDRSFREW